MKKETLLKGQELLSEIASLEEKIDEYNDSLKKYANHDQLTVGKSNSLWVDVEAKFVLEAIERQRNKFMIRLEYARQEFNAL